MKYEPRKHHKSNLLAWLRNRRKPKPLPIPQPTETEIILMSKILDLVASIKMLRASHNELKNANMALTAKVAELVAQDIAEDAIFAEQMSAIAADLDTGGSTGGVVG